MKKLLSAAIVALVSLAGFSASATSFVDGHCYKLRNVNFPQFYMNIEQSGTNNATVDETGSIIYAIQKTNDATRWHFRANNETGGLLGASGWNTQCNSTDTSHFWMLEEQSGLSADGNPIVKLKNDWTANTGYIGLDYQSKEATNTDKNLYCNGSYNQTWEVIEVPMPHSVNYTVKLGETTINTFTDVVEVGARYSTPNPPAGVTFSATIDDEELTSDKNITVNVNADNDHLFKLVSARYTNSWATTSLSALTHTNNDKSFADGEWFFEIPETNNSANFKIWSVNHARYVASIPSSGDVMLSTTAPGTFKIIRNANGSEAITNSSNTTDLNGDFFNHQTNNKIGRWHANNDGGSYWFMIYSENAWNTNKLSFCYSENTEGVKSLPANTTDDSGHFNTSYTFPYQATMALALAKQTDLNGLTIELTSAQAAAKQGLDQAIANITDKRFGQSGVDMPELLGAIETALTNVNNQFNEFYVAGCSLIANGDAFAALGIPSADGLSAWNTYKTGFFGLTPSTMTAETVTAVTDAYSALVASSQYTAGTYINIRHGGTHSSHYIAVNNQGVCLHTTDVGARALKLVPAKNANDAQVGFYIFNEYANKYLQNNASDNHTCNMVDQNAATVFIFELIDATTGRIKIKDTSKTTETHQYLHANSGDAVMHWKATDNGNPDYNSSWYAEVCDAATATDEHLNGAIALAVATDQSAKVNPGVIGYYTEIVGMEAYNAAKTAALQAQTDGIDKYTKADALWAAYNNVALNGLVTPTPGRYYRIKNKASGKYIHNVASDSRLPLGDASDANAVKTIWVFDGTRLIAYPSGLVMGKFARNDSSHSWGLCNEGSDSDHSGTVTFLEGHSLGTLLVCASDGRHIEGSSTTVNVGGDSTDDYSWVFEAVNWLPVREHDGNPYKTFITSEELEVTDNRYGVYEVSVDEDGISYNKLSGNIPAGKPVLLIENGGSQINTANHHVYLKVNHAAAPATAVTANGALHGSFKAGVKAEGKKYFALNENFAYAELAGNVTEGFTAYIEPGEDVADEELSIVLPATETKGNGLVSLSNGSHKITLSHSTAIHPNPAVSEPLRIRVKDDSEETETEEQEITAYRRVISSNNGDITINSSDFQHEYNAQGNAVNAKEVHATLSSALDQGEYTMTVPAGFLIADGATTPEFNYSFAVNADGTATGIHEVMTGLQQGVIYDLQGRKLAAPVKGINIIGGRKVLIK